MNYSTPRLRRRHLGQTHDPELNWVKTVCGEKMEDWRQLAARYMAYLQNVVGRGFGCQLAGVRALLEYYLFKHQFIDPQKFLTLPRSVVLPALLGSVGETPMRKSKTGIKNLNSAYDFLRWVLENDDRFSEEDDGGRTVLPGCRVPFARASQSGLPQPSESVRTPLPYKWIVELRQLVAPGSHFSDWHWAREATGRNQGEMAGDWFEVDRSVIDRHDPDCVWRERQVNTYAPGDDGRLNIVRVRRAGKSVNVTRTVYQLWSPVTAMALLMKLELPLRTVQVRMLDSGEADEERIELADTPDGMAGGSFLWRGNPRRGGLLATLKKDERERVGSRQGVFRKTIETLVGRTTTCFFVNTNKTADIDKDWGHRGYVIAWQHASLLRWLIKLRNWQEKYNSIPRPVPWTELEIRHTSIAKSRADLIAAPPTCFLFRNASAKGKTDPDMAKPISSGKTDFLWGLLLDEFERRLTAAGVRDAAGETIKLIKVRRNGCIWTTFFPLHSLRVSLLTALAFDGGVTLQTLMQLAGHSRILMAIYYQKMGSVLMGEELQRAATTMAARADQSLISWLKQRSLDAVAMQIATADPRGLIDAVDADPVHRSPAGWLRVHGGWCLVGGNTSAGEENRQIGGCFNGGPLVKRSKRVPFSNLHAPVRARNCVGGGCRFFVTRPEYMPEIKATLDGLLCGLPERQRRAAKAEAEAEALRREKYKAELADQLFAKHPELDQAASLSERTATELNATLEEIGRTLRLLDRCLAIFKNESSQQPDQLVAQGTITDVSLALETTSSELLQLSGVCANAEIYPELQSDAGEAVLRRSQLLDRVLCRERGAPLLGYLDKEEQLRLGNRLVRELTRTFENLHPGDGTRGVVIALESGEPLPPLLRKALDDELRRAGYALNGTPVAAMLSGQKTLRAAQP